MFRLLNKRKGQNTAEYAILIGVIVAAAIAMQIYVRRGMQARIKDGVDYMKQADDGQVQIFNDTQLQYEPYYIDSDMQTQSQSTSSEAMTQGGGINRTIGQEHTGRTGNIVYTDWTAGN